MAWYDFFKLFKYAFMEDPIKKHSHDRGIITSPYMMDIRPFKEEPDDGKTKARQAQVGG